MQHDLKGDSVDLAKWPMIPVGLEPPQDQMGGGGLVDLEE
jgi:hypothetical protein